MTLSPGTRVGPYQILRSLGAGGMGEVYLARDAKLQRDVAIKALPEQFASDPERIIRFQREAQLLAALNHPHIGAIYGVEESDHTRFLVLEYIDGSSLADVLRGGPLPIGEALQIARQVVEALEAAHERGIVHRDLKPGNIMVTADGVVKILDFGLARVVESEPSSTVSDSPTLTFAATQAGVILGTAAYMAPEQAKGRSADKRCDVWAFGCVLFEMLAGRRAFEGEDVSDTLAAVLRAEPDWAALPSSLQPQVRSVIQRCLVKDRKVRIPDFSVVRFLLDEPAEALRSSTEVAQTASRGHRVLVLTAFALAGAVVAASATLLTIRRSQAPQPFTVRFSMDVPTLRPFETVDSDRPLALSPNGERIVYAAGLGTDTQLFARTLDRLDPQPIPGTNGARAPFFSPDGHWIGYFDGVRELRKISVDGGPPIRICSTGALPRGAAWLDDDTIVFSTAGRGSGLLRVPASGGEPTVLTNPNSAAREFGHMHPAPLPGNRGVLFAILSSGMQSVETQVAVFDFTTGTSKALLRGGTQPMYLRSGHLLHAASGSLRAVPFDLRRLETTGDPQPVLDGVAMGVIGTAAYDVSRNGTLLYMPGDLTGQVLPRSLVWMDRRGKEEATGAPTRSYFALRLSPDGTRVALDVRERQSDITIWDFVRRAMQTLTLDPAVDFFPIWTPDSRRVVFRSLRDDKRALYWQPADGTGEAERLLTSSAPPVASSFSPDGAHLLFTDAGGDADILVMSMATRKVEPLIKTTARERNAVVSPDGRWVVYESDDTGEAQIYVKPFPNVSGGRWLVSSKGGTKPTWARDGREIFYLDGTAFMSVPVSSSTVFQTGEPVKLFDVRTSANLINALPYDVALDGRRFLFIKEPSPETTIPATTPRIVVATDWLRELERALRKSN